MIWDMLNARIKKQYEDSFEDAGVLGSVFLKVLGELEQILPGLSKTRWRKKSDFYSLFLACVHHVDELPLTSEKRELASTLLSTFATQVDSVMNEVCPYRFELRGVAGRSRLAFVVCGA